MTEERYRFLNRLAHDVYHSVKDVEQAAASRLQAIRGEKKPRNTNVNDKPAN